MVMCEKCMIHDWAAGTNAKCGLDHSGARFAGQYDCIDMASLIGKGSPQYCISRTIFNEGHAWSSSHPDFTSDVISSISFGVGVRFSIPSSVTKILSVG